MQPQKMHSTAAGDARASENCCAPRFARASYCCRCSTSSRRSGSTASATGCHGSWPIRASRSLIAWPTPPSSRWPIRSGRSLSRSSPIDSSSNGRPSRRRWAWRASVCCSRGHVSRGRSSRWVSPLPSATISSPTATTPIRRRCSRRASAPEPWDSCIRSAGCRRSSPAS